MEVRIFVFRPPFSLLGAIVMQSGSHSSWSKTKNPNPSRMENRFGFFPFRIGNRTSIPTLQVPDQ